MSHQFILPATLNRAFSLHAELVEDVTVEVDLIVYMRGWPKRFLLAIDYLSCANDVASINGPRFANLLVDELVDVNGLSCLRYLTVAFLLRLCRVLTHLCANLI